MRKKNIFCLICFVMLLLVVPVRVVWAGDIGEGEETGDEISGEEVEISVFNGEYDGEFHSCEVKQIPEGAAVTYKKEKDGEYQEKCPTYKDVGSYVVFYKVEKEGYKSFESSFTVIINPKEVGITWSNLEFTYNGQKQVPAATATELCGEDKCDITVEGHRTDANKGGEQYIATAISLSNKNYKLPDAKETLFKINPKEIGIIWSESEFTYNGQMQVPAATATGLCGEDKCIIKVEGGQIDANKEDEQYIATAASLDNLNYKLPSDMQVITKEFTIKKATMEVFANDVEKKYDGKEHGISEINVKGPANYEILYGETEENCIQKDSPKYLDVGEYFVYFRITAKNYNDCIGYVKIVIVECKHENLIITNKKEPTCTSEGYEGDKKCDSCDHIEKGKSIPAMGHHMDKGRITKPREDDAEGEFTYTCTNGCKHTKTEIIPRKSVSIELGKKAKIISSVSVCQKMTLAKSSKYKKYLTFNTKTGEIKTKKYYKVKICKSIPVKVFVGGKEYTVNIKIKIPAPKIKITRKTIKDSSGKYQRYTFKYNVKGASKIKVRIENANKTGKSKAINKIFDRSVKKTKSNKSSYIEFSDRIMKKLKKKNGKVTFKIIAYYGKNQSETLTITK